MLRMPGAAKDCYKARAPRALARTYNAGMKKSVHLLAVLCLAVTAFAAVAQSAPPPPPPGYGQMQRMPLRDWRELSPEQREQLREERRQQRREAWREMSPEERHQLRRDVRDAGRLYPRGPRRRDSTGFTLLLDKPAFRYLNDTVAK
jgi:hypothetical protein